MMHPIKEIPFNATGLAIFRNYRRGAVAGAIFKNGKCIRCAPILKKVLFPGGVRIDPCNVSLRKHAAQMYWDLFYYAD